MISCQDMNGGHTLYGLSSDAKPTSKKIQNGDIFIELDTSVAYFWDAENQKWIKIK